MLGWTPKAESEKLSRTELTALFDAEAIHSSNAKFDLKKAQWFNAQYLRELSPEDLLKHSRAFLTAGGLSWTDDALAAAAVHSVREKVSLLTELPEWVHYFFREDFPFEDDVVTKLKAKPENPNLLKAASESLAQAAEWTEQSVHDAVEAAAKSLSVKPGAMMPLLRFALSGQSRGPGVTTIAHLIGKEKTLASIQRALQEVL
jgi:glutamyl-tRNA synthetase